MLSRLDYIAKRRRKIAATLAAHRPVPPTTEGDEEHAKHEPQPDAPAPTHPRAPGQDPETPTTQEGQP